MSGTEDVLAKLLRGSFRGVEFFTTGFGFGFDHQHVQHLYPDRDAGFVEATGRNPAVHSFQVIFRNGNLLATEAQYPLAWRKMVSALLDRSVGTLLHPELGPLKVKAAKMQTQWDLTKRDGIDMTIEFVETTDAEDELAALFSKSAAYTVEFEAGQLDKVSTVGKLAAEDDALSPSLLDSIKQITGSIAMAQASLSNVSAQIQNYANAIGDLADKVESLNNPSDAGIVESLKRLYGGTLDLLETAKPKGKPVAMVLVTRDAPTAAVAASFGNSLEDFLSLNPALGAKTSLPADEPVFVYAA